MTRSEFIVVLVKLLNERAGRWLPEEATEEMFLSTFRQRIDEHDSLIRDVLQGKTNFNGNGI